MRDSHGNCTINRKDRCVERHNFDLFYILAQLFIPEKAINCRKGIFTRVKTWL